LQFPAVTYLTSTMGLFQFEIKMTRHTVQRICCGHWKDETVHREDLQEKWITSGRKI